MELTGLCGSLLLQLFYEAVIKAGTGEAFINCLIVTRFLRVYYGSRMDYLQDTSQLCGSL